MKKTALKLLLISWLAASTMVSIEYTVLAKALWEPAIVPMEHGYIRSNGDIDPPTLPITRSGNLYTLQDNIMNYSLEIQKDNVMIDGKGYSMSLPFNIESVWFLSAVDGNGLIQISNTTGVIVKNVTFSNYFTGVRIENSSDVAIIQNNMTKGCAGIFLTKCTNCSIIGNNIANNSWYGFNLHDSTLLDIAYNNVSNNGYGGLANGLTCSNITRNAITHNKDFGRPGLGLYLDSQNFNNSIFENNFIDNSEGLAVMGNKSDNAVYSNFWKNDRQDNSASLYPGHDNVDISPLGIPIDTSFDPSMFPLPFTPTVDLKPTVTSTDRQEAFPMAQLILPLGLSVPLVAIGLLFYFKKRQKSSL